MAITVENDSRNVFVSKWQSKSAEKTAKQGIGHLSDDENLQRNTSTLWLCQQFAIENGHRNSEFSH